jgi:hypothetical protein
MKAILGEGNAKAISGSSSQCRKRLRAMTMPASTPMRVASASPVPARNRLSPRSLNRVPSPSPRASCSTTEVKEGRNSGGASLALVANSQTIRIRATEPIERKRRAKVPVRPLLNGPFLLRLLRA